MTQIAQSFASVIVLHPSQMTHTPHNHLVACLANQIASHSWTSYLIVLLSNNKILSNQCVGYIIPCMSIYVHTFEDKNNVVEQYKIQI